MPTCSARWATPRTADRPTLGGAAANIARELGTPLMPWQRQVLDVGLELDPATRRLVYREVILTVPRQSGKTTALLVLILLRALGSPRQNIRYTAQTGSDARKKWTDDWLPILEPSKFASTFRVRLTNGHEALRFKNGSFQGLVAGTQKTGHGAAIDLGIIDEAFAQPDARIEQALKPAMITRPQPQLWIVSTAGTPETSPYLLGKVENGREIAAAGLNHSVAYFEWSAADDLDPADPATWWTCMPALGRTAAEQAVRADFESMALNEFERAYLNRWKTSTSDPVISIDSWRALTDRASTITGPLYLAFDVTPDRALASIGAAGLRADGRMHVEVIEQGRGTAWLAPRIAELAREHRPRAVLCDPAGPAGSLLVPLDEAGVEVTPVSAKEHAQACGMLFDAVDQKTLAHLGTPELVAAIDGAVKRKSGDGAWLWGRVSSSIDISPLVAITLAFGAAQAQAGGVPEVWSLDEIVAGLRAEQDDAAAAEPAAAPPAAGGSRFVPLSEMPVRRSVFRP